MEKQTILIELERSDDYRTQKAIELCQDVPKYFAYKLNIEELPATLRELFVDDGEYVKKADAIGITTNSKRLTCNSYSYEERFFFTLNMMHDVNAIDVVASIRRAYNQAIDCTEQMKKDAD